MAQMRPGSLPVDTVTALAAIDSAVQAALSAVRDDGLTTVNVDNYGAVGNGTTDDLNAFIAAVATGQHVALTPGKVYGLTGFIELGDGQHLYGNGATLKRLAQATTTTTTSVAGSGTTQITVASPTGFKAGQYIGLNNGATWVAARKVVSVVGNVITVSPSFNEAVSGTTTVFTAGMLVNITGTDAVVRDLTIDGNKIASAFAQWDTHEEIRVAGDRGLVTNCYLYDCTSEGVTVFGCDYARVEHTMILRADGNGIHFSAANHPTIHACTIIDVNIDPTLGHQDGAICWSNLITDATISDCYLDTGISGIGSIDSGEPGNTNSHVTVTGCTIRNMTSYAIDTGGSEAATDNPTALVFVGNRIYDSVDVYFGTNANPAWRTRNIVFSGNYVENTRFITSYAEGPVITGNVFVQTDATVRPLLYTANTYGALISGNRFYNASEYAIRSWTDIDITISNNQVLGAAKHCLLAEYTTNLICANNLLKDSRQEGASYGAYIHGTSFSVTGNTFIAAPGLALTGQQLLVIGGTARGIIDGNRFECNAGSVAGGINVGSTGGVTVSNNMVADGNRSGITISGNAVVNGNICRNNGRTQTGNAAIFVTGGNVTLTGNRCYDDQGAKTQYYGIRLYSGAGYYLSGNRLDGNASTGLFLGTATDVNVVPNRKLTATVNIAQVTVAHGLSYAPQSVAVSMTSAGTVWKSAASDATNIYLSADADGRTCDIMVG